MKRIVYIGEYIYVYLSGIIHGMKYSTRATPVYIEAKEKGGFDKDMEARLIDIARDYQKTDLEHRNVYDIIKFYDNIIGTRVGIHLTE